MNINTFQKFLKRSPFDFAVIGAVFLALVPILAQVVFAQKEEPKTVILASDLEVAAAVNRSLPYGKLEPAKARKPATNWHMPISAYNSVEWQTDATPCIGAAGIDICVRFSQGENICAANFVPLGTRLSVEGLGECTVLDRMNARYTRRVDWYMGMDIAAARNFGVRYRDVARLP